MIRTMPLMTSLKCGKSSRVNKCLKHICVIIAITPLPKDTCYQDTWNPIVKNVRINVQFVNGDSRLWLRCRIMSIRILELNLIVANFVKPHSQLLANLLDMFDTDIPMRNHINVRNVTIQVLSWASWKGIWGVTLVRFFDFVTFNFFIFLFFLPSNLIFGIFLFCPIFQFLPIFQFFYFVQFFRIFPTNKFVQFCSIFNFFFLIALRIWNLRPIFQFSARFFSSLLISILWCIFRWTSISMSSLYIRKSGYIQAEKAHADPHRRKTLRMRHLSCPLHSKQQFKSSQVDTYWRQTCLSMWIVSNHLWKENGFEVTRAKIAYFGESLTL